MHLTKKLSRRSADSNSLRLAFIFGLAVSPVLAQDPTTANAGDGQNPTSETDSVARLIAGEGCRPNLLEQYTVRKVTLNHPLHFLHSIEKQLDAVRPKLRVKAGARFSTADASADRKTIYDQFPPPSDLSTPVSFQDASATVTNCVGGQLDVDYFVFSSQFLPVLTGSIESRRRETTSPQNSVHVAPPKLFQLTPVVGYNSADGLFGGARFTIPQTVVGSGAAKEVLRPAVDLEAVASPSFHDASAALYGSATPTGFIRSVDWQLRFHSQSLPTGGGISLHQDSLIAQSAASSRAIGSAGLLFRFGGQIQGGNLQSGFQRSNLPAGTVPGAGYGALKLYSGLTFGTTHQSFSASYGFEVGGIRSELTNGWRKQLGDVSWDIWFPVHNHQPLQIETRFTAGALQSSAGALIPVAEKFFGGNVQQNFVAGDNWDFRGNPVIRGIPAQHFFESAAGPGADRFYALNLTAAFATWHKPLVPAEITGDADFQDLVKKGWEQSEATDAAAYKAKDPHAAAMAKELPDVKTALDELAAAVSAANPGSGSAVSASWSACNLAVIRARARIKTTVGVTDPVHLLGNLEDFTSEPSGGKLLPAVLDACEAKLNATLQNVAITAADKKVRSVLNTLETERAQISNDRALALAQHDLIYPKRVLRTILNDLNIWSVSPVGIFDVARIDPQPNNANGGLRYAPGAGLRLILVSHVNFTVGYARNLHRLPGEGTGALFFSMGITELLR